MDDLQNKMESLSVRGDDRKISVPRSVLVEHSKYSQKLFGDGDKNDISEATLIEDISSFEALQEMVNYFNTQQLQPTTETIAGLVKVAVCLECDSAMEILCGFCAEETESTDLFKEACPYVQFMPVFSRFCSTSDSLKELWKHLSEEFGTLIYESEFLQLEAPTVLCLISSDWLVVPEEMVYRAIQLWINHDHKERKGMLSTLIQCVRYDPQMTPKFIMDNMVVDCNCDKSIDFVISLLALRNGIKVNNVNQKKRGVE